MIAASVRPYLANGMFLTDLREAAPLSQSQHKISSNSRSIGTDLFVTVVAEGKIILPPHPVRLKLPPKMQTRGKSVVGQFRFSPDGKRIVGKVEHGYSAKGVPATYIDLCIVSPTDGQVRMITRNRYFWNDTWGKTWRWSPDNRRIAAVEQLDKPPLATNPSHVRLVTIDLETGESQTLFEIQTEQEGLVESIPSERVSWAIGKTGERGVVFYAKAVADKASATATTPEGKNGHEYAWFFAPVPDNGRGGTTSARRLNQSDLRDYSVYRGFPAAVVEAERQSSFDLDLISPSGDMALFHRTLSGVRPVSGSSEYPPWEEVSTEEWKLIDRQGKGLLSRNNEEQKPQYDWTWDQRLLILEDADRPRIYSAVNPVTCAKQTTIVPVRVPGPWEHWLQLSPADARRTATQWSTAHRKP